MSTKSRIFPWLEGLILLTGVSLLLVLLFMTVGTAERLYELVVHPSDLSSPDDVCDVDEARQTRAIDEGSPCASLLQFLLDRHFFVPKEELENAPTGRHVKV